VAAQEALVERRVDDPSGSPESASVMLQLTWPAPATVNWKTRLRARSEKVVRNPRMSLQSMAVARRRSLVAKAYSWRAPGSPIPFGQRRDASNEWRSRL
jgi:hypothetical protein